MVKFQPSPEREKEYFANIVDPDAHLRPPIEVSFERPSIMDNPLAATAARLAKKHLEKREASIKGSAARIPLLPELPSDFPEMPSTPTPDTILEWLGSTQSSPSFPCPRSLRPVSSANWSPFKPKASELSMAGTPEPVLFRRSDPTITVEHIENRLETNLVTVPESRLLLLEAKVQKADLNTQLSDLKKQILKISLSEDDFVTEEQRKLRDDTDLKQIKKATEAGLDLLNIVQYNNPLCKDDPMVFQEVYDHWSDLRQSVATYLVNRSGAQHENQIKWEKYFELTQQRKYLRARIEEVSIAISNLEGGNMEKANSTQLEKGHDKITRRDSAVELGGIDEVPYFPSCPVLHANVTHANNKAADSSKVEIQMTCKTPGCTFKHGYTSSKPESKKSTKVEIPTTYERPEYIVKSRYKSSKPEVNTNIHLLE
ncbi:hypothetical protein BKA61DRAFT_568870 [Leptodontidium sp. MPI-SDFR-AT-0119]|nr:hypothetical protein BKA61DRAFT_568870 [Leptodontidium sp. MPI-SDFR-AT-0119]